MNQTLFRNPLYLGAAAIGALILFSMSVTVVPETQQAIISSYGKVDRVVNAYRKGEVFGDTDNSTYDIMGRTYFISLRARY